MLEVTRLKTQFKVGSHHVTAVDGVTFDVPEKAVVGIVGESGSGKSVTALSIMGLLPRNGAVVSGDICWGGESLLKNPTRHASIRGAEIGLIFQNPLASLNPVFTIGSQMIETIMHHHKRSKDEARNDAIKYLTQVNIPDAETRLDDYPHQFSLGMCQRIMIALTLAMQPALLIADEPTASLDVTIQAQILALLKKIQENEDMSILIISHDLGVMAQYCDVIHVMYLGRIVESGCPDDIFNHPKHPYTQALISAIPSADPGKPFSPQLLEGDIPSPMNVPEGCRFHTRCPKAIPKCRQVDPQLEQKGQSQVACIRVS